MQDLLRLHRLQQGGSLHRIQQIEMMHRTQRFRLRRKLLLRQDRGMHRKALLRKQPDRIGADKACRTGNQYLHSVLLLILCSAVPCAFSP